MGREGREKGVMEERGSRAAVAYEVTSGEIICFLLHFVEMLKMPLTYLL